MSAATIAVTAPAGMFGKVGSKAFPISQDEHLLSFLRYVERNPLRANLVERAEDWPWSSLRFWAAPPLVPFLHPGPMPRGPDWLAHVNGAQTDAELARLRVCVARGQPFGGEDWVRHTASALGLESSRRPRGRPAGGPPEPPLQASEPGLFPEHITMSPFSLMEAAARGRQPVANG
jgi:hypothetical protein